MTKPAIQIEVVSDVVCPWCYIGKRRMEKAVDQLKDQFDFTITYTPFELNPHIPPEGLDQKKYLSDKFGGDERYEQITQHVTRIAAQEGLRFDFSKQIISPNTRNAHRIIQWARQEGRQPAAKEAFMKAYFEDGIDLSKKENLIDVAVKAGLDRSKAESLLDSDEGLAAIKLSEKLNSQRGISGVPFYIINNQYGFSGAQPVEVFVNALKEIGSMNLANGEVCETDKANC